MLSELPDLQKSTHVSDEGGDTLHASKHLKNMQHREVWRTHQRFQNGHATGGEAHTHVHHHGYPHAHMSIHTLSRPFLPSMLPSISFCLPYTLCPFCLPFFPDISAVLHTLSALFAFHIAWT